MEPTLGQAAADATPNEIEPYLIVRLHRQDLALPARYVREIIQTPHVVAIPGAPSHLRGVINVRGDVVRVLDLRRRMGLPPRAQETHDLLETLTAREQDHRNWIQELEASVREQRPFKLARDPHQCKFGKWYDTYQPDNIALEFIWNGFDQPHQRIHAIADVVLGLVERGEVEPALARIEKARATDLRVLVEMFAEARQAIVRTERELAVLIDRGGEALAVMVDGADAVEPLAEADMTGLSEMVLTAEGQPLVSRTARRPGADGLLLVLEVERLFPQREAPAAGPALAA